MEVTRYILNHPSTMTGCKVVVGVIIFFLFLFFQAPRTALAASGSYDWTYGWTRSGGGAGNEFGGQGVAVDGDGNIFITGGFEATVNFDGTGGSDEHTASSSEADIFITKYNADGSYGWTKTFGGTAEDYGMGIAVDSDGNILVTGYFQGTVNFNDSGGTDNHTASGLDIFVTKYYADGSYGWTRATGSASDQLGYGVAVDSDSSVIVVGRFSGTVNFDTTGGTDTHASTNGNYFVTKYNSDGSYAWTRTFGNTLQQDNYGVVTDSEGYIYATGFFYGTADFDGSESGEDSFTSAGSNDIFITRLSSDGTYKWTKTYGSSGDDRGSGITTDNDGHVIVTGYFSQTVNFDTNGGTDNHISAGGFDIFISKLKVNGSSVWTKSFGSSNLYEVGGGIDTDTVGNIFVTGAFGDTVNFDANGGTDNHTSGPGGDAFITKYNADGTYGWTRAMGGTTADDSVEGLSLSASTSKAYTTGYYIGTVDFDGSSGTDNHTSEPDTFDFFVTHYTDDVPTIGNISTDPDDDTSGVTWTTDVTASTQVEYGLTQYFGKTTTESDTSPRVTSHIETVPGLITCARYQYRVLSADSENNKGISTRSSFNTSGCLASSIVGGTDSYIETTGGTLELSNGQSTVTLLVPSGYYSEASSVQINILDSDSVPSAPSGTSLVRGNFYNLLAVTDSDTEITSFDELVIFTINYGSDTESAYNENTLDVYKYTDSTWQKQNCTLDTSANTITCSLGGFSIYGVFGQESGDSTSNSVTAASAPICQDTAPVGWPDLFQIDASATQAILYYAPINGSNSDYYISFSENSNTYKHGAFTGQGISTGVLSYTVNYLKPNTVYYFRVRGQNGCMPGDWSNEMKIITTIGLWGGISYYKSFLPQILNIFPVKITNISGGISQISPGSNMCEYSVQPGDSLWNISLLKFGTGTRYGDIMQENSLSSTLIRVGQKLKIGCQYF